MRKTISYRFLKMGLRVSLGLALAAGLAQAQDAPRVLTEAELYCTGVATNQPVPADTYVISGESSNSKNTFAMSDLVYINRGAEQGVQVGDEFEVIRPTHDALSSSWFKWQAALLRAMGTMYTDIGQLRVVNVLAKTSIAEIKLGCDSIQRGDIVRPFTPRPAPPLRDTKFDIFAPPSGKKTAMVVTTRHFGVIAGSGAIEFINLGSGQGVKVGDYFRVFRYQGSHSDSLYYVRGTAYKVYGFGSAPVAYQWNNLPRQILAEGIVLRVGPNSSTVLLTSAREAAFDGDYAELE
jgi:hypothetical protein